MLYPLSYRRSGKILGASTGTFENPLIVSIRTTDITF